MLHTKEIDKKQELMTIHSNQTWKMRIEAMPRSSLWKCKKTVTLNDNYIHKRHIMLLLCV